MTMLSIGLLLAVAVAGTVADVETISSYANPVGTSYEVPLTNSYSAPTSNKAVPYSPSADDLARSSDLSNSASRVSPVYSAGSVTSASAPSSASAKKPYSGSSRQRSDDSFSKTLTSSYSYGGAPSVQPASYAKTLTSSYSAAQPSYPASQASSYSVQPAQSYVPAKTAAAEATAASERSDLSSSYQAAPAVEQTYSAPVSTGNLYYYYYPVQEQAVVEKADDELDPLVLILLPITVIIGLLALLSIINVTVGGGRAAAGARGFRQENSQDATFGSIEDLQTRVDTMLTEYSDVLRSEGCMDRVVCELGTKAKDISAIDYLIKALDWIIPATMAPRIDTFKEAVYQGYDVHQCKRYECDSNKIIEVTRRK